MMLTKAPAWFWAVAGAATLWEVVGCFQYWGEVTMDAATLATLPDYSRIIVAQRPLWSTAGYAIGTWGGLAGMIALLLRRAIAVPVLLIALFATLASYAWPLLDSGQAARFGPLEWSLAIVIPLLQLAFWLLARHARTMGWIG
jgi:hypothetical protein